MLQGTQTTPPDLVKGSYTTDLNIIKIHEAILLRFSYFHSTIPLIESQIKKYENDINPDEKTINEIKEIENQISVLKKLIDDYTHKRSYNKYLSLTKNLIEEYATVATNKSKGVIIFKQSKEKENPEIVEKRLKIIRHYLDIAKDYIRLEIIHHQTNKINCPGCGINLNNIFIDEEIGLCICPECGYERETISHNSTFRDIQRSNNGNRNNYDDCENFRKALLRFQGKQVHKPPSKLYDQLDTFFEKTGKPSRQTVQKQSLTPDGKKKGTSRQMMFEALAETNNSAYYDDINLIMHEYWGWNLPDISHLEEQIMEDYIATQQVYNSIPNKDRDASLNIQFRLFVHLKAVDYQCNKDDFKIQTSRDSLIFHSEMWKIMCDKTGIKFFSVI